MHPSPRVRRLYSDRRALEQLRQDSTIFRFTAVGEPSDYYKIQFVGRGLARAASDKPVYVQNLHEVHIRLGANYPRAMPDLSWKTPIFHPNVSASGFVCLGGYGTHWVPGVSLEELCVMLWDMVRYENYDVASPYNREAAQWVNEQRVYQFPLDHRPLRDNVAAAATIANADSHYKAKANRPTVTPLGEPPASVTVIAAQRAGRPIETTSQRPAAASRNTTSGTGAVSRRTQPAAAPRVPPPHMPAADAGVIFLDDNIVQAEVIGTSPAGALDFDAGIVFLS